MPVTYPRPLLTGRPAKGQSRFGQGPARGRPAAGPGGGGTGLITLGCGPPMKKTKKCIKKVIFDGPFDSLTDPLTR